MRHLNYGVWATAKISEIIENADESLLKKEMPGSFPTIEKTLLHIWDAELIWFKRLQGGHINEWPSGSFAGDREALIGGWVDNCVALRDFAAAQGEDWLQKSIHYHNFSGTAFSNTAEEILYHVVNHGSYHRGQLVTMLHNCGISQFSSTDLITYIRLGDI